MAPTIIVGDDENAGEVAGRLLELADRPKDVRTRTDLARPAFDVPDDVYAKYNGKGSKARKVADDEERHNQFGQAADDADTDQRIEGDELPETALNADPADIGEEIGGPIEGDELPDAAKVVDPPSNGDAPNSGEGVDPDAEDAGDGEDQGDGSSQDETPKPKPRKRAPRKATKSTPAAAGSGE